MRELGLDRLHDRRELDLLVAGAPVRVGDLVVDDDVGVGAVLRAVVRVLAESREHVGEHREAIARAAGRVPAGAGTGAGTGAGAGAAATAARQDGTLACSTGR